MYDSIIILGATATGKTKISIELAKSLNTDIINADSMYIYKKLDIGTAKPSELEMQGIKHHLIDIIEPENTFNVAEYRVLANERINALKQNNKVPIIVGGTGFYIDSLVSNYSYGQVERNIDLRNQLETKAEMYGNESIYKELIELAPDMANKIHVNDRNRIIRGIEIALSGSTNNNQEEPILHNPLLIGLSYPRELLYERINKRVDIMIQDGLIEEVRQLSDMGLDPSKHQSMKGIGYKEIFDYMQGQCSLEYAIEKIKQHTRNYAKRQITWFKRNNNINWIDLSRYDNSSQVCELILNLYNK